MNRKLFCEFNRITYKISVMKERLKRHLTSVIDHHTYSRMKGADDLEYKVYKHNSLIMRKLGNNDLIYQSNKKKNLEKVAPLIDGIFIKPGEVFSFWKIVGKCTKNKGFLEGVTISNGEVKPGTAGGMCQMTNLIHWMVLHSPLDIIEHHHHHRYDLFPDYNRQIPFGTGTSIMYNYLDYQFKNTTKDTFQLRIKVSEFYLEGALRSNNNQLHSYHIVEKNHQYVKEGNDYYRCNEIYQKVYCKKTGNLKNEELLLKNKSLVKYDMKLLNSNHILTEEILTQEIR